MHFQRQTERSARSSIRFTHSARRQQRAVTVQAEQLEPRKLLSVVTITNLGTAHDNSGHSTTGWTGFLITIQADAGKVVTAVDMGQDTASANGIFGNLLQRWFTDGVTNTPTPVGGSAGSVNGAVGGADTHVLAQNGLDFFAHFEDSDLVDPAGAPANGVSDLWGTGSYLRGVFGISAGSQVNSLDAAYVVLKDGTTGSYSFDVAQAAPGVSSTQQRLTGHFSTTGISAAYTATPSAVTEPAPGQTATETFTVTLSHALPGTATVDFTTVNGTAIAGTDYDAASGTLTFTPGQTSKTIDVTIHGVSGTVSDKTFTLHLSNPSVNSTITTQDVTATITHPVLINGSVSPVTEPDVGQTVQATFTLTLSEAKQTAVTVDYATASGTALAGTDFDTASGTVTFAAGETSKQVTVTVHGVANNTSGKTFSLNLSNPSGAILSTSQIQETIAAQPPASISGVASAVTEPEVGQTAQETFTVTLSKSVQSTVTVDYQTADGTAAAGTDYDAASGTLTFAAGETSKQVIVTVHGVAGTTTDKAFLLNFSNPSGGATLATTQVQATISAGNVRTFDARHRLIYTDASNHTVLLQLVGPGSGQAIFTAASGAGDPKQIALMNTTLTSVLLVRSVGGATTLPDVDVQGSLGVFGGNATIAGNISISGGARAIALGNASGDHTITIGQGPLATAVRLGNVTDLSITSAGSLGAVIATSWTDSDATPDTITAGSLNALLVNGAFGAGLELTGNFGVGRVAGAITGGAWNVGGTGRALVANSIAAGWAGHFVGKLAALLTVKDFAGALTGDSLNAMRVGTDLTGTVSLDTTLGALVTGGSINGAQVRTVGNINVVSAGTVINSIISAGLANGVEVLPTDPAQFTTKSSILVFAVRGKPGVTNAFAGSIVAASTIKQAVVRQVQFDNGGTPFGLAAESMTLFGDIETGQRPFIWRSTQSPSLLTFSGDFKVSLL
jgi:hypothetical protein